MLQLAQVQKNSTSGDFQLQILAHQIDDDVWQVENSPMIIFIDSIAFTEGTLVLLEKASDNKINNIKPAKDWVLSLLQKLPINKIINSQLIAEEKSKIEQWRQEVTIQNLELNRQFLEIETRREQLQELEQSLKQDREKLQLLASSLEQKKLDSVTNH